MTLADVHKLVLLICNTATSRSLMDGNKATKQAQHALFLDAA